MRPAHYLLPLLVSCAALFPANAQEAILDQYVQEGLTSNLALKQENLSLQKSMSALDEAKSLFLPTLDLDARYSRAAGGRLIEFPTGDLFNPVYRTLNQMTGSDQFPTLQNTSIPFLRPEEHETKLRLTQPLLQPGILYNHQVKQTQVGMQQDAVNVYKRQLATDIRVGYYNYLKTVKAIALYERVKTLQNQNLSLNQKLFDNQKITYDAIYATKAELSNTELKLAEAAKDQQVAAAYFNFLLNRPLDAPIETDTTFEFTETALPDTENLAQTSLQNREELQQLSKGIQVSNQSLKLTKSNALPTLNLVVDYGFQGTRYSFTPDDDFIQGSLLLSWRIFGGLQNRARISQAQLDRTRLQTQQNELQQQIKLQVTTAAENLKVARQNVFTASEQVTSAQKYFRIVNRKYEEGAALYVEYLNALTTLTNAENTKIIAEYDYKIRVAELNRAVGR